MKNKTKELSDYSIGFNRRSQRNELNIKGIWLGAVRKQTTLGYRTILDHPDPENKLYFVS